MNNVLQGYLEARIVSFARPGPRRGMSDKGDDRLLVDRANALYGIADGISEGDYGWVASEMAIAHFRRYGAWLAEGVRRGAIDREKILPLMEMEFRNLSNQVMKNSGEDEDYREIGTTLDVLMLERNEKSRGIKKGYIAHCGDGRVYLRDSNGVRLLTKDHKSVPQTETPEEQEMIGAMHSSLANYIGLSPEFLKVDLLEVDMTGDWMLLLCSDGVHDCISPYEMRAILSQKTIRAAEMDIRELLLEPKGIAEWILSKYPQKYNGIDDIRSKLTRDDKTFILIGGDSK